VAVLAKGSVPRGLGIPESDLAASAARLSPSAPFAPFRARCGRSYFIAGGGDRRGMDQINALSRRTRSLQRQKNQQYESPVGVFGSGRLLCSVTTRGAYILCRSTTTLRSLLL
jgi:hypothetical protein